LSAIIVLRYENHSEEDFLVPLESRFILTPSCENLRDGVIYFMLFKKKQQLEMQYTLVEHTLLTEH